jgi:hypothetical protein
MTPRFCRDLDGSTGAPQFAQFTDWTLRRSSAICLWRQRPNEVRLAQEVEERRQAAVADVDCDRPAHAAVERLRSGDSSTEGL